MMLDTILNILIGIAGGGGITGLLWLGLNKRRLKAEVLRYEQQNQAENNDLITVNQKLMNEQNEIINDLRAENVFCKSIVCKHGACPFREPERGRGKYWLDAHKDEGEGTLIDVIPIQLIAQKYGFSVKYNKNSFKEVRAEIREISTDDDSAISDDDFYSGAKDIG